MRNNSATKNRVSACLAAAIGFVAGCDSDEAVTAIQHNISAQNIAGIQSSPVEFKNDTNKAMIEQVSGEMDKVTVGSLLDDGVRGQLKKFITDNGIQFATSQHADIDAVYAAANSQTMWDFLKKNSKDNKKDNYSVLDRNTKGMRYTIARDINIQGGGVQKITNTWLDNMQSMKDLDKLLAKHKIETLLALFVFDVGTIHIIEQNNQLSELARIRKAFFDGPLGNKTTKASVQYKLLTENRNTDVLLINETFPEFTQAVKDKQWTVFATKNNKESIIAIHPDKWKVETAQEITLKLQQPDADGGKTIEDMQPRNVGVKVQDKGNRIYHLFSMHSNSTGEWSIPTLNAVDKAVAATDYVVVFHDANTHVQGKTAGKADAQTYINHATKLGFKLVHGSDPACPITYSKEKTRLQTQANEADQVSAGRGDFILVRGPKILQQERGNSFLDDSNAADHTPLYATVR